MAEITPLRVLAKIREKVKRSAAKSNTKNNGTTPKISGSIK